jgi:FAD/FMN-containing dehydrogenase
MQVQAHALNGIVTGSVAGDLGLDDAVTIVNRLTTLASDAGGNLTIRRCPPAWKRTLRVWGRPTADRDLMRHVKRTLDPADVFNPGRLFADL